MRRAGIYRWIAPAVFVLAAGVLFLLVQQRGDGVAAQHGRAVDRALPEFALPAIEGYSGDGLSSAVLREDSVSVVNFFASWCIPCLAEHRYILQLGAMGVAPFYGVNLRDEPDQARRWLRDLGDGYAAIGADRDGAVTAQLGVIGIPTTMVVDGDGRVRYVHTGPLTERSLEGQIVPVIQALSGRASAGGH